MTSAAAPIRILSVDDHALIRQGVAGLLAVQPDMKLIAEASNGREAIHQFRQHRPDITLMDLQMPEMGGLDAIMAIRGEFPDARVIVLTTYAGDVQALRALKAGARGYLLKDTLHKELLDTIRAVHAGKKSLSPEVSFQLAEHATDRRPREQADRRPALDHRGHRQGASEKYSLQAGGRRPDARGDDRVEARDHRAVAARKSARAAHSGLAARSCNS